MILAFASPTTASLRQMLRGYVTLLNSLSNAIFVFHRDAFISSSAEAPLLQAALVAWKEWRSGALHLGIQVSAIEGVFRFQSDDWGGKPYSSSEVRCAISLASPAMGDDALLPVHHLFYGAHLPFPTVGDKKDRARAFSSSMAR